MNGGHVNISQTIVRAVKTFGGVQVASNICSVILNKLVAVWIGPVGFGLFSLYNAAIDMIRSATSLGIRNSCVRDMAVASESGDETLLGRTISVIRRWAWFVGIFGAVTTMALAPTLSRWSFGNTGHLWDFVLLASTMLFSGLANCELAILQGLERLKPLANASLLGAVGGLAFSVPLFYFLRADSILISVIVYHATLLGAALLFRHKNSRPARLSNRQAIKEGSAFVKLGIFMTLSDFVMMLFTYIFSAYLNRTAGTEEVGFYQAGFSLVGRYVGLVFTALSMEYYPRLARICRSRLRLHAFVSQEINILMLSLVPLVTIFLTARELIVWLLYSEEFHTIVPYISWAVVGTFFKAFSWCMAMVILAKGDGKVFIVTETTSTVTGFLLNVAAYNLWGLDGLGIAYMAWYAVYCLIIGFVYFRRYGLSVSGKSALTSVAAIACGTTVLVLLDAGFFAAACVAAALFSGAALLAIRRLLRSKSVR